MDELLKKLPNECFAVAVEKDDALYRLAKEHFPIDARCALLDAKGAAQLGSVLCGYKSDVLPLPPAYTLRRAVRLDLSGGVLLDRHFYDSVFARAAEAIARYWKNRATMIRFGRLYSRNVFKNIARLPYCVPLREMEHTVQKPIAVFGAGESMEKAARDVAKRRECFYVIAVDAAVLPLVKIGITPDALVTEEAQSVIADAFIGLAGEAKRMPHAFLSINGWSGAFDAAGGEKGNVTYYATQYFPSRFLHALEEKKVLPPLLPPLGSVGLTATKLALMLRREEGISVFVAGLDFSYSAGTTHTRGATACVSRLSRSLRLSPFEAYSAAFGEGAIKADSGADDGKGAKGERYTMPNMVLYAALFKEQFAMTANLFNAGKGGVPLGIPAADVCGITETSKDTRTEECPLHTAGKETALRVKAFYASEKYALLKLRSLLTGEGAMDEAERKRQILEILQDREYLYLHFPDYTVSCTDLHFLRRVRAEIDLFLKDIGIGDKLAAIP